MDPGVDDRTHATRNYSRLMTGQEYTFSSSNVASREPDELVEEVRKNVLGSQQMFIGPYGDRKLTYADFTASGKNVEFIEAFIHDVVMPMYANTHTTTSVTGHQMTLLRHEARLLIKRLVNANFSHGNAKDVLLFHGSGVTGCINAVVAMLGLDKARPGAPAVVFVGPYEHHSNLLPWRESPACRVVQVGATATGAIDVDELERLLRAESEAGAAPLLIGAFSAASNVTGILTDTDAISSLLHRYGALAFFDYATAGPYVHIDMNPRSTDPNCYKDAVFFSPHKFLGGPGSPGVIIIKKRLVAKSPAIEPGGGTVFFVTPDSQRYLRKVEEREEGGTQDIIGCIRAALAFKLKASIGEQWIMQRELKLRRVALARLQKIPNLILMGFSPAETVSAAANGTPAAAPHYLPIFSFVVSHHSGRMLHWNFVCALLNDLFGLQLRGGCMCAGPFAMSLLGMTREQAAQYEAALVAHDDSEMLRPGFVRFNLHYTMTDATVDFVLRAIEWVAANGWKLMPDYAFDLSTAEYYHPAVKKFPGRRWLADLSFDEGSVSYESGARPVPAGHDVLSYFGAADAAVRASTERSRKGVEKRPQMSMVEGTDALRWFVLPQEVSDELASNAAPALWSLELSPLRTSKLAGTPAPGLRETLARKALAFDTSAPADDDFFGTFEEEDAEPAAVANTPAVAAFATGDIPVEGEVCGLPGAMRDRIDVEKLASASASVPGVRLSNVQWHVPHPKKIVRKTLQAIKSYDMLRPGDRVLVCVSGGKDSLTLLHTLRHLQAKITDDSGRTFHIGAVTVDPMTVSFDPRPLIPYMAALGVPYHYEQQPIIDAASDVNASSICSWCSRMKRGIIYRVARTHGYNVVAMGQHLDDMAESFMMSVWLNGILRTQKACYVVDDGDLRFCRPLAFVREQDTKQFAIEKKLPVISETCPACFSEPKERARIKTLLKNQEALYPHMYDSMRKAMDPLMRALPVSVEARERAAKSWPVLPALVTQVAWVGAGILLGCLLCGPSPK